MTYLNLDTLTPIAFDKLKAADAELVGTEHYIGLADFWNYAYRNELREATPYQRRLVHRRFLRAGLAVHHESNAHHEIVRETLLDALNEAHQKRLRGE